MSVHRPVASPDALAPALRDVRAAAWQQAFDAFLREHPPADPAMRRPFDPQDDYLRHVDGKSRLDGAAAFLASRDVEPSQESVRAVAEDKELLFTRRLSEHGIDAYPGTVALVRALRRAKVARAAASASRHAGALLAHAGVLDLFDVLVDGGEAARLHLPGKPKPDLFLEAARRLGVPAGRAAVVEDALAGVEAGRAGGFALVIGVDRTGGDDTGERLLRHGADIVVRDLGELLGERRGAQK